MNKLFSILGLSALFLVSCGTSTEFITFENEDFSFQYPENYEITVSTFDPSNESYGFSTGLFPLVSFDAYAINFTFYDIDTAHYLAFEDLRAQHWAIHIKNPPELRQDELKALANTVSFTALHKERALAKAEERKRLEQERAEQQRRREKEYDKKMANIEIMKKPPMIPDDKTDYSQAGLFDECLGLNEYANRDFFENLITDLNIKTESAPLYFMPHQLETYYDDYLISDACFSEKLGRVLIAGGVGELGETPDIVVDYNIETGEIIRSNIVMSFPWKLTFGKRSGENIPLFADTCGRPLLACTRLKLNYNLRTRKLTKMYERREDDGVE